MNLQINLPSIDELPEIVFFRKNLRPETPARAPGNPARPRRRAVYSLSFRASHYVTTATDRVRCMRCECTRPAHVLHAAFIKAEISLKSWRQNKIFLRTGMPIKRKKYQVLRQKRKAPPPDQPASLPGRFPRSSRKRFLSPESGVIRNRRERRIAWRFEESAQFSYTCHNYDDELLSGSAFA